MDEAAAEYILNGIPDKDIQIQKLKNDQKQKCLLMQAFFCCAELNVAL